MFEAIGTSHKTEYIPQSIVHLMFRRSFIQAVSAAGKARLCAQVQPPRCGAFRGAALRPSLSRCPPRQCCTRSVRAAAAAHMTGGIQMKSAAAPVIHAAPPSRRSGRQRRRLFVALSWRRGPLK